MLRMWWARWSIWIISCALATAIVIGNAFYQKKQFYPTVVFITKSKPSMAVMYAQALLFVVMLGKLFRKVFFGQLRAAEFEHLVERSWYAVTETCLAFTVFRDDFSPKFLALFTLLLFLKSFHWLAEERVDYMERSPVITWVFHVRVLSLLSILLLLDGYFVNVAYQSTITKGASVQLVFGFEYAILTTIVLNTVAKYVFHVIDMRNETPWENKAVFVLHTEVVIGLFKVVLYVVFVVIMVRIYTLPLFALRPTYLALRSFKKALNDVVMSRRAINNMNNLYPDVTQEELASMDNVCIICREEMTGGAKKLPCNHIFHVSCLRSWFQRQQTCPTCRLNVLRGPATTAAPAPPQAAQQVNFGAGFNQFQMFGGQQQQPFRPQQPQGQGQGFDMWGQIPPQWMGQQQQQQQPPAGAQAGAPQPPGAPAAGGTPGTANQTEGQAENTENAQGQAQGGGQPNPAQAEASTPQRPHYPYTMYSPMGTATNFAYRPSYSSSHGNVFFEGNPPTINPFSTSLPPMPYIPLVPPPPPLLQTTGLSDEELRRMEGGARENIEARLRCLRNVQILLDSAVVQMQQYSTIVSNLSHTSPTTQEPTPSTSTSTTGGAQNNPASKDLPSTSGTSEIVNDEASPLLSNKPSLATAAGGSGSSNSIAPTEQDELRKRRLQKFTTTDNQSVPPPPNVGE